MSWRECRTMERATTITTLCLVTYESWWARKRNKWSKGGIAPQPSPTQRIPFKLEIGAEWIGMFAQYQDVDNMIEKGNAWCELYPHGQNGPSECE